MIAIYLFTTMLISFISPVIPTAPVDSCHSFVDSKPFIIDFELSANSSLYDFYRPCGVFFHSKETVVTIQSQAAGEDASGDIYESTALLICENNTVAMELHRDVFFETSFSFSYSSNASITVTVLESTPPRSLHTQTLPSTTSLASSSPIFSRQRIMFNGVAGMVTFNTEQGGALIDDITLGDDRLPPPTPQPTALYCGEESSVCIPCNVFSIPVTQRLYPGNSTWLTMNLDAFFCSLRVAIGLALPMRIELIRILPTSASVTEDKPVEINYLVSADLDLGEDSERLKYSIYQLVVVTLSDKSASGDLDSLFNSMLPQGGDAARTVDIMFDSFTRIPTLIPTIEAPKAVVVSSVSTNIGQPMLSEIQAGGIAAAVFCLCCVFCLAFAYCYHWRKSIPEDKAVGIAKTNLIGPTGGIEPKEGDPVEWGNVVASHSGPLRSAVGPRVAESLKHLDTHLSVNIDESMLPSLEIIKNSKRRGDFAIL